MHQVQDLSAGVADLRERLAIAETNAAHSSATLEHVRKRMLAQDERMTVISNRLLTQDGQVQRLWDDMGRLQAEQKSLREAQERCRERKPSDMESVLGYGKWLVIGLIVLLTLLGKLTPEQARLLVGGG